MVGEQAFTKEIDSFERLNVKTDVLENALDRQGRILPGKVVMAKKPLGDGTPLKKRKGCCVSKFPTSRTRRLYVCEHAAISDVANVDLIGVIATLGSSVMGCFNSIPLRTITRRPHCVLQATKHISEVGSCETRCGLEIEKSTLWFEDIIEAWEEERDEKLQNQTWTIESQQIGQCKVCVKSIPHIVCG